MKPTPARRRLSGARPRPAQRGIAALVVVMVLFFIVSLTAAYTARNLVFEQRTSANQYRSTAALEAAEAGLEWALSMLNHGRITDACAPSALSTDTSFRQRYIDVVASPPDELGRLVARRTSADTDLLPSCVFDGTNWRCSCPSDGPPALSAPAGTAAYPAFRVRFRSFPPPGFPPGVIQVEVNGCTRLADACLNPAGATGVAVGAGNEGSAFVAAFVVLAGGPLAPPGAALTARGGINTAGTGTFSVANTSTARNGVTLHAGGPIDTTGLTLTSLAGVPGPASVVAGDAALGALGADGLFASVFSTWRPTFRDQPALVTLDCGLSRCTAAALRAAAARNPGQPLRLATGLLVDSSGDIGSVTEPVTVVVTGGVEVTTPGVTLHGLLYVEDAGLTLAQPLNVRGAAVVEGAVGNLAGASLQYDENLLAWLRATSGSYARLPGSWRDFP